jgi:histidinol-phosphatase
MTSSEALSDDLHLAIELGRLASELALPIFRRGVVPKKKSDGSPVTEADVEVERRLVEILAERRPHDAVLGEEGGARGSSRRCWIIDPIDGTSFFAAGQPTWGTHVALEQDGELVLGLITRPVRGEQWWAWRGGGAYRGALGSNMPEERLRVSDVTDAARARVMRWGRDDALCGPLLVKRGRWVDAALDGYLDVANGRIDALIDSDGMAWDLGPAVLIVEEAGGRFVDRDGGRRLDRIGGWFTNGRLHAALGGPARSDGAP